MPSLRDQGVFHQLRYQLHPRQIRGGVWGLFPGHLGGEESTTGSGRKLGNVTVLGVLPLRQAPHSRGKGDELGKGIARGKQKGSVTFKGGLVRAG